MDSGFERIMTTIFPDNIKCIFCKKEFIGSISVSRQKYGKWYERLLFGDDFFLNWDYDFSHRKQKDGIYYDFVRRCWHKSCAIKNI